MANVMLSVYESVYVGVSQNPSPPTEINSYQPEHVWFHWVGNRSCMAEEHLVVEDVVSGAGGEEGEGDLR